MNGTNLLVRGLSTNTGEAYIPAVAGLTQHYDRSPDRATPDEVQEYMVHLIGERNLTWSSCSSPVHRLRFFYEVDSGRRRSRFHIPMPRRPVKQPGSLSRPGVARLFESTPNLGHDRLPMTTYAAGLRVSEVVHLKVSDVQTEGQFIRIDGARPILHMTAASAGWFKGTYSLSCHSRRPYDVAVVL